MNFYLVKTQTYFIDGHNTEDDGGAEIAVISTIHDIDTSKQYKEEIHDFYDELDFEDQDVLDDYVANSENYHGSEDGYNSQEFVITYLKIDESDVVPMIKTIGEYDKLMKKFNKF